MKIKDQAKAYIELNPLDKTFISNSACKKCGGFERYTRIKHPCVSCQREKNHKEYKQDPDGHKTSNKAWHQKNKEYVKSKARADYLRRKESESAAI